MSNAAFVVVLLASAVGFFKILQSAGFVVALALAPVLGLFVIASLSASQSSWSLWLTRRLEASSMTRVLVVGVREMNRWDPLQRAALAFASLVWVVVVLAWA